MECETMSFVRNNLGMTEKGLLNRRMYEKTFIILTNCPKEEYSNRELKQPL